jgi:hypothetical protein
MRASVSILSAGLLLLGALLSCGAAGAAVLDFDFANVSGGNPLDSEITVGGVVAHGFFLNNGQYQDAVLWNNNSNDEHGIGVCSEGTAACTGVGDVNEVSNQQNLEVLRLTLPAANRWSSLWVSSLDAGGSGNNETGTLYWSNQAQPELSTLSTQRVFAHSDLSGANEADLLALPGFSATFDPAAKYLFFRAGPNPAGNQNDYLVWGGNLRPIPEPAALLALLAGLTAVRTLMVRGARKSREDLSPAPYR